MYIESSLTRPIREDSKDNTLQLTGHLGDVMKESAQIAHTVAKAFMIRTHPDNTFLHKANLHLHVPEVGDRGRCNDNRTPVQRPPLERPPPL